MLEVFWLSVLDSFYTVGNFPSDKEWWLISTVRILTVPVLLYWLFFIFKNGFKAFKEYFETNVISLLFVVLFVFFIMGFSVEIKLMSDYRVLSQQYEITPKQFMDAYQEKRGEQERIIANRKRQEQREQVRSLAEEYKINQQRKD